MKRRSLFLRAAAALDDPTEASTGAAPEATSEASSDVAPAATSEPAAAQASSINRGALWDALSTVIDPEIGLDIVTLGLVYSLDIGDAAVQVTFTLTTPGCPMEEVITGGILTAAGAVDGVEEVIPNLVWEPRWHPGMIQEGAW